MAAGTTAKTVRVLDLNERKTIIPEIPIAAAYALIKVAQEINPQRRFDLRTVTR